MKIFISEEKRLRRNAQICKVYTCKFDYSHQSDEKLHYLKSIYLEAKWLYNAQLASGDIFTFPRSIKQVAGFDKARNIVTHNIECLSSQMKQNIIDRTKNNVVNLYKSKKKDNTVGKLKFKSFINSIPLSSQTFTIRNNKYIHLQGFKKDFKIEGLHQIPKDAEIANATLIRNNGNYYIKITCFLLKEISAKTGKVIGLDFGIHDAVITSDRNKYNFQFPETRQLKRVSRKFNKTKLTGKNHQKLKLKLRKQYEKITNKKTNSKNKFVHKLLNENDIVVIQEENLKAWHSSKLRGFGRKVQYSIMGGIISGLKQSPKTLIVDKFFPSTQLCPKCGYLNKTMVALYKRIYFCDCGYVDDRDIHSAINILSKGLKQVSTEHRNIMPEEDKTSCLAFSNTLLLKVFPMSQEAFVFRRR